MSNWRQIETTLSPLVRAVRIASTSSGVSGVRDRRVGFETAPGSGSVTNGRALTMPGFACSHAELSRSNRAHVFRLSPPASTKHKPPYSQLKHWEVGGLLFASPSPWPHFGHIYFTPTTRRPSSRQAATAATATKRTCTCRTVQVRRESLPAREGRHVPGNVLPAGNSHLSSAPPAAAGSSS